MSESTTDRPTAAHIQATLQRKHSIQALVWLPCGKNITERSVRLQGIAKFAVDREFDKEFVDLLAY